MNWDYYCLNDQGVIVDLDGDQVFAESVKFTDYREAEQWLIKMDYRGSVMPPTDPQSEKEVA
jgi:hypothetical protein